MSDKILEVCKKEPIKNFVNSSIKQIDEGLPNGYELCDSIYFELSVRNENNIRGGLSLIPFKLSGAKENGQTQKIRFEVRKEKHKIKVRKEGICQQKFQKLMIYQKNK